MTSMHYEHSSLDDWHCIRCGVRCISIPRHDDVICEWCAQELKRPRTTLAEALHVHGNMRQISAQKYSAWRGDTVVNARLGYIIQQRTERTVYRRTMEESEERLEY